MSSFAAKLAEDATTAEVPQGDKLRFGVRTTLQGMVLRTVRMRL